MSQTNEKDNITSKMNFVEKFYWADDDEELQRRIHESCLPKYDIFNKCVEAKSYNRCIVPERRDYQRCLLEEKLKYTENKHSTLQRWVLKAEYYRGNAGDTPSDYIEQRFEEDRNTKDDDE